MKQALFDWLCGLIISGDIYALLITLLIALAGLLTILWEK